MKIWFSFVVLVLAAESVIADSSPAVEFFSPEGTVKKVSQVTVRFTENMIPFGDLRHEPPFVIGCSEKGSDRWVDQKNWAYEFGKELPAGTLCEFTLKSGIKALSGKELTGRRHFKFSTGGPSIYYSRPYEGSTTVNEDQIFVLFLDAVPNESSVVDKAYFTAEGIQERIGVRVVTGSDRKKILKAESIRGDSASKALLLQAKQNLPPGAKVSLVWGQGILTSSGVPTEADQVFPFQVRVPFRAEFSCDRENENAACLPVGNMTVSFTGGVERSDAARVVVRDSAGKSLSSDQRSEGEGPVSYLVFRGPFPENSSFTVEIPRKLKDDAGRALANQERFPLTIKTGPFPPLAKFSGEFGILELKGSPVLPVTVRNLEADVKTRMLKFSKGNGVIEKVKQYLDVIKGRKMKISNENSSEIIYWLKRVANAHRETSVFASSEKQPPVQGGGAAAEKSEFLLPGRLQKQSFEVIGIPLKDPGLYVVELESLALGKSLLGKPASMFVPTAALVTNLSVHFKSGRESSLIWVTQLDDGKPASGAQLQVIDCSGKVLWTGRTDGQGVAAVKGVPTREKAITCNAQHDYSPLNSGLLVTARRGNDLSFVHTSWQSGIESWRFQVSSESSSDPNLAHTVFDRSLLRAGEEIHMKHFIRRHVPEGFASVPIHGRPQTLMLEHQGSEQKYYFPLKWDASGIAETTWSIPKGAKLGAYGVYFQMGAPGKTKSHRYGDSGWYAGAFRVEEFRIPLAKAFIKGPVEPLVGASQTSVDLMVQYLAGGGASKLPVRLSHQIQSRGNWEFPDYAEHVFANGPVKLGRSRTDHRDDSDEEPKIQNSVVSQDLVLDKFGAARASLTNLKKEVTPYQILAELQFKDPNGETQTVASSIPVFPARHLVGIKLSSWAAEKDRIKFQVTVLDVKGKPVADAPVNVEILERKRFSHRKRIVGGFYSYESFEEVNRLVSGFCDGKTDGKGNLHCEGKAPTSGNLTVQAKTRDATGAESIANRDVWVAGDKEWWYGAGDNDRMDLIAEKNHYEPGETAKFQVRMPFREATALVAVEREGVMETFVREISGKAPFIEVPVKGNYAPNIYVSVLAVRGRVGDVQPTALVDLGRPAYKLGITSIRVGWRAHELKVKVTPAKSVYQVREKATVKVKVTGASGGTVAGGEVALAAVDEGLLELMNNSSWQLLDAMMGVRGYAVENSSAQMHVVGKRHFGLKALPSGGGGAGDRATRELFDTLLLWKGRVRLDKNGEATVNVPLNDSLTSFKIVAVANASTGLFGTGSATLRSTQDLMILPGLPKLVRQGDKFRAQFTVRNAISQGMAIGVSGTVSSIPNAITPLHFELAGGESRELGWDITVPNNIDSLTYELAVVEKQGRQDKVRVVQKVVAAVPVRTFEATVTQLDKEFKLPVERPKDSILGRGGVQVGFKPSLLSGLNGIRDFMRDYPYSCLEQDVSRAVSLRDKKAWADIMERLPSYLDHHGLAKYFPLMEYGSDTLTAYVLAIAHEAGWLIPQDVADKMTSGLKGFVEGKVVVNAALPTSDLSARKIMAVEALSRRMDGKIEPSWLSSITIEPNLWPTSAVIDWFLILSRGKGLPDLAAKLAQAEKILRSRINFQGTQMSFSNEKFDSLWWLMISADRNAVRAILALMDQTGWKEDMPRLVKGALGRQHRGHWDLTTANAWGVLAMEKFATKFEKTPVAGISSASVSEKAQSFSWAKASTGETLKFAWPEKRGELRVKHEGAGKPWVVFQALAAIPLEKPLWAGYRIEKTIQAIEQKESGRWSRGDLARVRVVMRSDADMTWVVLNDPIPAGSTLLGSGLGRDSRLATQGEKKGGVDGNWVYPAFEERSFEAYRSYYELVNKGEWATEYTLRLNNAGTFSLPPTRVEAMYAPEMFGELPNAVWEIRP